MNKQNFVSEARFNATQLINELFMLILWLENEQAPKTGIGSSGLVSDLIEVMDLNYLHLLILDTIQIKQLNLLNLRVE